MSQGANSDVHRAMGDFRVELLRQVIESEMAKGRGAEWLSNPGQKEKKVEKETKSKHKSYWQTCHTKSNKNAAEKSGMLEELGFLYCR